MARVEITQPVDNIADAVIKVNGVEVQDCEGYKITHKPNELPRVRLSIVAIVDPKDAGEDAHTLFSQEAAVAFVVRLIAPYLSRDTEQTWTLAKHPIRDEWIVRYNNAYPDGRENNAPKSFTFTPEKLVIDGATQWEGERVTDVALEADDAANVSEDK